jgi:hypothetical protein
MTTIEMTNQQARMKHRTTTQLTELYLQSAEDYHRQYREAADESMRTRRLLLAGAEPQVHCKPKADKRDHDTENACRYPPGQ